MHRAGRLQSVPLPADPSPLPDDIRELLTSAATSIDAWFQELGHRPVDGFVPSDYEQVYRALRTLRARQPAARRFCEWGAGLGVVVALADRLGFEAHGIEVDPRLAAAARRLLATHRVAASIVVGNFMPEDPRLRDRMDDPDGHTRVDGPDAHADMDLAIDDFDVVFAYPWPGEAARYRQLFARCADFGSVLLLFSATEGVCAWRKSASTPP